MQSGAPIRDDFLHGPQPRANHRHATGKRFHYRHREILIPFASEDKAQRPFQGGYTSSRGNRPRSEHQRVPFALRAPSESGALPASPMMERNTHPEPLPRRQQRHHALLRGESA